MIRFFNFITNKIFPSKGTSYLHFLNIGLIYSLLGGAILFGYWWNVPIEQSKSSSYDVIQNIYEHGSHKSYNSEWGFWTYAIRMPFVPYFSAAMGWVFPGNKWFGVLLKNLIFIPIFFYSIHFALRFSGKARNLFAALSLFIVLTPYFLFQNVAMDVEEPFIIPVLSLLMAKIFFDKEETDRINNYLLLFILISMLFLTKSSLLYFCLIMPLLIFLKHRNKLALLTGYIILGSVILSWGLFNYYQTGNFRITSSINGLNFYKGNNLEAYSHYPLDLDFIKLEKPQGTFSDEWELDEAYLDSGKAFVRANPEKFLSLLFRKTFVFFADIYPSPYRMKGISVKYRALLILNLIMRFVFIFALLHAFLNLLKKRYLTDTLIYTVSVLLFSLPFIIGFAYTRHYLPLIMPSVFYLIKVRAFETDASAA